MKKLTYKASGVNIQKAEEFVKKIKVKSKTSAFGSFFNLKEILKKYKKPVLVSSTDGVGTKLKIAQYLGIHNTVGIDLVAMNVNDIICLGAKPLFFLDYIACGKLNVGVLEKVVDGIKKGLEESNCVLLGGETAEMPGMYKKGEYDLAGFCVGIADEDKIIDGRNIQEADVVIGIASSGLHSNGFSLVRKIFAKKETRQYAKELLMPTRIYVKPILSLLSARASLISPIKGIAHVTGGAFYEKATKILPSGYGMVIYKKSWQIPPIFKLIQRKGNIAENEMYSVFNMGIGMIVVVKSKDKEKVLRYLNRFYKAHIVGEILKAEKRMVLS
ncbi:MAG: phosphoribosylformylglycinamidine cyclo-ligase [Candidatus Omnitrophota bacterium]|nr:MAG: phosphoribosylformylglycinamidine cyclo-ligase [Candidatus Omnitrophota bacterium]